MAVRLDRLLANAGEGTRTEVRAMIRQGRVAVHGVVVTRPELAVQPDQVTVDGRALDHPGGLVVALHKPAGFVTSHADTEGQPVFGLLPERWLRRSPRLEAVGRLDRDTTGLLLVTDQHRLIHELTSPRHHVDKRYEVTVEEPADLDHFAAVFGAGTLVLDGAPCRPATLEPLDAGGRRFAVTLTEGRHRQVRRMVAAVGGVVVALHRTAVGPYRLGDLGEGGWRIEAHPASRA